MIERIVLAVASRDVPRRSGWTPTPVDDLAAEFPAVELYVAGACSSPPDATIDVDGWLEQRHGFSPFDELVARVAARDAALFLAGRRAALLTAAPEILTRYQRELPRRNDASSGALFEEILRRHRLLHDLDKPLVRADYDHALDTWQWMLRLAPSAGLPAQIAALFHDVERLVSEPDVRIEQHASDYAAFKARHARDGAAMVDEVLADIGLDPITRQKAVLLVAGHERPNGDEARAVLNDADALSFFSLNSSGFWDYYGPEHTRKKVAYSVARMRPATRHRLGAVRLRPEIARLLWDELRRADLEGRSPEETAAP